MDKNKEKETLEIDDFLDLYDGNEEKKPVGGFLDDLTPDMSLDDVNNLVNGDDKKEPKDDKKPDKNDKTDFETENVIPDGDKEPEKKEEPKVENMASIFQKLIDDGTILPFDEDKKLEEYTIDDFKELIKCNVDEMAKQANDDEFNTLSPETRALLSYERNGGKDVKEMMYAIASAKQTYDFDISTPSGQKDIIRSYMKYKGVYKNDSSLEREISRLEDAGELQEKAEEFKPLLEEIQVNEVNKRLQQQEYQKQKIKEQAQLYNNSIKNTLSKDDVNGVPMTNKVKNMIYSGLVNNNYQLLSGRKTNLLYHLLEKKQYIEPDHSLIAEVTWLLSDPEGYKQAVSESIKKKITSATADKIKGEQQGRSTQQEYNERKTIKRVPKSFF